MGRGQNQEKKNSSKHPAKKKKINQAPSQEKKINQTPIQEKKINQSPSQEKNHQPPTNEKNKIKQRILEREKKISNWPCSEGINTSNIWNIYIYLY